MLEFDRVKAMRMNAENGIISMKQRLDTFQPLLNEFPFAGGYFNRIAPLLYLFPDAATEGCIFETDLGSENFSPDFSVHFSNHPEVKDILSKELPEFLFSSGIWTNLREFIKEWQRDGDLKEVINFWLEFDMMEKRENIPIPGVFFRTDLSVFRDWVTDTGLQILNGTEISMQTKETLKKCFGHLPDGAVVSQLGIMHSRASKNIRTYVRNIKAEDFYPYMERIEYTGDIALIKSTLGELLSGMPAVNLQLDAGQAVPPEIAFEFKVQQPRLLLPVLEYMEKNGLCTRGKKGLITCWPCQTRIRSLGLDLVFIRYISHLKIALCSDRTLKAKAYLGVYYS